MSSYLFKHSSVGAFLRYCRKGNFSYTREHGKNISESSSSDDVTEEAPAEEENVGIEKKTTTISAHNLVTWKGPDDPSNPQNWPISQKVLITAVLRYVFPPSLGA